MNSNSYANVAAILRTVGENSGAFLSFCVIVIWVFLMYIYRFNALEIFCAATFPSLFYYYLNRARNPCHSRPLLT